MGGWFALCYGQTVQIRNIFRDCLNQLQSKVYIMRSGRSE